MNVRFVTDVDLKMHWTICKDMAVSAVTIQWIVRPKQVGHKIYSGLINGSIDVAEMRP